jgi:hypothetical protein
VTWSLAGGAGASALASGIAFSIREADAARWNDDSRCLDRTAPARTRQEVCGDLHSSLEAAQTVEIVTGAAAIALGGAALIHVLVVARGRPSTRTQEAVRVTCGVKIGGVLCDGSF